MDTIYKTYVLKKEIRTHLLDFKVDANIINRVIYVSLRKINTNNFYCKIVFNIINSQFYQRKVTVISRIIRAFVRSAKDEAVRYTPKTMLCEARYRAGNEHTSNKIYTCTCVCF